MSMNANRTRLAAVTTELSVKWAETKEHWQDGKSAEFEAKYMDELTSSVDAAVAAIEELDKLVAKIRSDCE